MRVASVVWSTVGAVALLGCGGGCDGDRLPPAKTPTANAGGQGTRDGSVAPAADAGVGVSLQGKPLDPAAIGYLDAPVGSLEHVFEGLSRAESGRPDGRVLVTVFGDSHTSGDAMTSRLRTSLQTKFGDAGRGLVAAGKPTTRHYYQRDVRYGASGAWRSAVGGKIGDAEPFGVAGLRVFGDKKGAQLWVETCADCMAGTSVSQFEILYQAAPAHGTLRYRIDGAAWQQLPTATTTIEPPHPARQVIAVPDGPHKLVLEHGGGGQIDLYGVVMERSRPGVVVDSLGVVGRRLGSLRSWDWSIIGEQLATRDPRLVVLQYGTNEADDSAVVLADVARYYDDTILRIRAAAPTASILILGPPDMGVREAGKACDRRKPKKAPPPSVRNPNPPIEVDPDCVWRTPGVLNELIAVQHAAAARNKVAFFDTLAAMGGADKMDTWASAEPPEAFRDRVHFTEAGYHRWADLIEAALLTEYTRWRAAKQLPPSRVLDRMPQLPAPAPQPLGDYPTKSPLVK